MYYRYTLETGIAVLEWWEALLVNMYFILLIYSLARHTIINGVYVFSMLSGLLTLVRNRFLVK